MRITIETGRDRFFNEETAPALCAGDQNVAVCNSEQLLALPSSQTL